VQPDPVSTPSVNDAVRPVEQLSLTVAVPNAPAMSEEVGLQLRVEEFDTVITGTSVSLVNVTVCDVVDVLPQASVAVQVLVTLLVQPDPVSAPSVKEAVRPVEQLSLTLAVPNAPAISEEVGLQLSVEEFDTVITGASVSRVNETVCDVVDVLPQASVAVQVLVTLLVHPLPVSAPSVKDAVRPVEQLSLTLAVPNAPAMSDEVGLQLRVAEFDTVITGASVSRVNVTV
jgi:hypothetical protein